MPRKIMPSALVPRIIFRRSGAGIFTDAATGSDAITPPRDGGGTSTSDAHSETDAGNAGNDAGSGTSGKDAATDTGGGDAMPSACAGGRIGTDSAKTPSSNEYGAVKYQLATSNAITSLETVLTVPKTPRPMGTLFIWPGLQWLGGSDPARNGNGILQPVLTWGGTCAPGAPNNYDSWWISGMYVNVSTGAAGPAGCAGGAGMDVNVGDALKIDMTLSGTTWKQVIFDEEKSQSVDFSIDLKGQTQDWATFAIEEPQGGGMVAPPEDVLFTQTVLTFASPVTSCQPNTRGPNDYFTAPELSTDGLHCCIAKITLRAQGVAATTPDSP